MATNSSSSRADARRRRMERGSDRLALITGRIDNLPASSRSYSDLPPAGTLPPSLNSYTILSLYIYIHIMYIIYYVNFTYNLQCYYIN